MYIPLRQVVQVYRPGIEDIWGNSEPLPPFELKCRADEKTQLVKNQLGAEVMSTVELMFKRLPDISYNDEVEYINEVGTKIKRAPELIAPARTLNGKPVYTSIYL